MLKTSQSKLSSNKAWRVKNRRYLKDYDLKRKYGISLEDYEKLLETQNYSCKICLRHISELSKNLSVDHNHKTGKVRGLLCSYCNLYLLTNLNDDAERALRAYKYLIGEL